MDTNFPCRIRQYRQRFPQGLPVLCLHEGLVSQIIHRSSNSRTLERPQGIELRIGQDGPIDAKMGRHTAGVFGQSAPNVSSSNGRNFPGDLGFEDFLGRQPSGIFERLGNRT